MIARRDRRAASTAIPGLCPTFDLLAIGAIIVVGGGSGQTSQRVSAAMTIALEKPLKYFLPNYFNAQDEKLDGQEWELVYSFRESQSEDLQELAIKRVEQLAEMKLKGRR